MRPVPRIRAAVIIPHFEDPARLSRCVAALAADPEIAAAEVVVIDNGSSVDPAPCLTPLPAARLVREVQRGAAAARNRGVSETTAEALLFLDCDCVPERGWIGEALAALEGADVVGGCIDLFDETPPPRSGAEAFEAVFGFRQRFYVERLGFTVTANMATRRDVFQAVGPFDGAVAEDVDWCRRATALGCSLRYAENMIVAHPTRSTFAALRRKAARTEAERFALAARRPWGRARWALRAAAVLASPLVDGPRLIASARLRGAGERLRGVAALTAIRALRAAWMIGWALGVGGPSRWS